jgi:hypothetical protein
MPVTINGTTGITNDGGYTGDGVVFADATPANTLVTTTGGNVGIGTSSPAYKLDVAGALRLGAGADLSWGNTYANNGPTIAGSTASGFLAFYPTGALGGERARIDTSGNLLVGTTSAGVGTATGFRVVGVASNADRAELGSAASTNSGIGWSMYSTGAGAYRFFVGYGGTIYATSTSITAISDQSLKENIRDLDTGLAEVMALKPRRFDWKPEIQLDETNVAGFIAQEVAEVLPELVYDYQYNQNTVKKGLKMGDMLPTLVKAIQEQQAIITDQDVKIGQLVDQLTNAESTMNLLTEMFTESQQTITALTARVEAPQGTQP